MHLYISNFGPISNGTIEVKKVTVLIGNQGSGKSTVAKLLSTFCWIEKYSFKTMQGENIEEKILLKKFLQYHRIENYYRDVSQCRMAYLGEVCNISQEGETGVINKWGTNYILPKITYFPAERSFISSIKNVKENQRFNLWSKSLQEFKEVFQEAIENLKNSLHLPINNTEVEYHRLYDKLYVKGANYKIPLSDSASGFQSFVPMYVVANYITKMLQSEYEMNSGDRELFKKESVEILNNPVFTEEQKRMLLSNLAGRINVKRMINIIEEPEQNLYPSSQRNVLNSLLGFNNEVADNKLILTTHSPYILSYLMLAVKAAELREKAKGNEEILSKIYEIVPEKAITPMKDVVIYELNDDGTISELKQVYGLPSNDNFLNNELGEVNTLFSELMEIEDLCHE